MRESHIAEARPYHHGDLRRALVDAARQILEAEGPSALSLRAVAREAGVSPAAPYHHFKDKAELLDAVAQEGWEMLNAAMASAADNAGPDLDSLTELGVAYVCFARENPALYRVMYDTARDKEALPEDMREGHDTGYTRVRDALLEAGADPAAEVDLELATIASWCAAHGLAEMAAFRQFAPLKEQMGGETAFIRAILQHSGLSTQFRRG